MGEEMVIDVDEESKQPVKNVVKPKKRKRDCLGLSDLSELDKGSRIEELKKELDGLFLYFKEVSGRNEALEEMSGSCTSVNSVIACLLEESDLPFSKLVDKIYEKVKSREEGVTLVSVRSSVLNVGQRSMYGIANEDDDVLEDSSEKCLWCWETRDMKLIPKAQRGILNIRRTCRKRIQDRISAVSAMIATLQALDANPNGKGRLTKASEKLVKVLGEAEIRLLVDNMVQKSGTEMAEKESKLKEKELVKELEKNKRELEKEKKRMERELLKEKLQKEKEQKRLQDEAEKEEKLREAENKKQIRRQQEEAEKDQRRREKEEAQLKAQLSLRKQATLMERFLKCSTKNADHQDDLSSPKTVVSSSPMEVEKEMPNSVTLSMDSIFSLKNEMDSSELQRSHFDAWNKMGHSIRSGNPHRWGMRQKPKAPLIKELKLQSSSSETVALDKPPTTNKSDSVNVEKVIDGWVDNIPDDRCDSSLTEIHQVCNRIKKLLQFDKSCRPAYYGTLSVKSDAIGPRHPFSKDSNLDYEVESDEEWEEEEPGESLSDCDKDEAEDSLVEGNLKVDEEDGSEDGFLVPDGYLSDNEGVQVDSMETDSDDDDDECTFSSNQDIETEEFQVLFRQQKYMHSLTEQALRKSQPLIISNIMQEKTKLLTAEDLNGIMKLEQMFLQALKLRPFPGCSPIEISANDDHQDVQEPVTVTPKAVMPKVMIPKADVLEKDLSKVVEIIQSGSHGINKLADLLQPSFPSVPKSQLRNKVREIAEFVDNRWQVKKEILDKLGVTITPERKPANTRGITAFFSKRCLPPDGALKTEESSPQQIRKPEMRCNEETCTVNIV